MNVSGASASDPTQRETKRVNINTSLGTLNPIHYEGMNPPNLQVLAGTHGGPKLTMRDIVKWKQEEAFSLGEIGFHTNFPKPSDLFQPSEISTDPSGEAYTPTDADNDAAMTAAMQGLHRQIVGLQQRKQVMDANQALVAQTELDITKKLRAAGVPEERLGPETTLREKVVELVRLKMPEPEPNFVSVYVEPSAIKGQSQTLEINLPLEASIAEIYALLDEVVVTMLSLKGYTYVRGGVWKYQLVDQSRASLLLDKALLLETDVDYKMMLQKISSDGDQNAPVAVLTQVRYCSKSCLTILRMEFMLIDPRTGRLYS